MFFSFRSWYIKAPRARNLLWPRQRVGCPRAGGLPEVPRSEVPPPHTTSAANQSAHRLLLQTELVHQESLAKPRFWSPFSRPQLQIRKTSDKTNQTASLQRGFSAHWTADGYSKPCAPLHSPSPRSGLTHPKNMLLQQKVDPSICGRSGRVSNMNKPCAFVFLAGTPRLNEQPPVLGSTGSKNMFAAAFRPNSKPDATIYNMHAAGQGQCRVEQLG